MEGGLREGEREGGGGGGGNSIYIVHLYIDTVII